MIAKWEFPLNLLDEREKFVEWYREVGVDEANLVIGDAVAAAIKVHGPNAIFEINERMSFLIAQLQEHEES
jgi:hypothetical protein